MCVETCRRQSSYQDRASTDFDGAFGITGGVWKRVEDCLELHFELQLALERLGEGQEVVLCAFSGFPILGEERRNALDGGGAGRVVFHRLPEQGFLGRQGRNGLSVRL